MSKQPLSEVDVSPLSPFRTRAWLSAWLSTYGDAAEVQIIKPDGSDRLEEYFYLSPLKLRGMQFTQLVPLGCSNAYLATPRSEYNGFNDLSVIRNQLSRTRSLGKTWSQLFLPDMGPSVALQAELQKLALEYGATLTQAKSDLSYRIAPTSVENYMSQLSRSTRTRYFGNRRRLSGAGKVELKTLPLSEWGEFVDLLNSMHLSRWKKACYSHATANFINRFLTDGAAEGLEPVLSVIEVDGEACSVLLDVVYAGNRYNLQSGFVERFATNIQLGSLHLGYAIEDALKLGLGYDFLAGTGRSDNYKSKIATEVVALTSYRLERGLLGVARKASHWFKAGGAK